MSKGKAFLEQDLKVEVSLANEYKVIIDGYPHHLSFNTDGKGGLGITITDDITHKVIKAHKINKGD